MCSRDSQGLGGKPIDGHMRINRCAYEQDRERARKPKKTWRHLWKNKGGKKDQRTAVAETQLLSGSKLQRKRKEHVRGERGPQTARKPHKPDSSTGRHMPIRQLSTAG